MDLRLAALVVSLTSCAYISNDDHKARKQDLSKQDDVVLPAIEGVIETLHPSRVPGCSQAEVEFTLQVSVAGAYEDIDFDVAWRYDSDLTWEEAGSFQATSGADARSVLDIKFHGRPAFVGNNCQVCPHDLYLQLTPHQGTEIEEIGPTIIEIVAEPVPEILGSGMLADGMELFFWPPLQDEADASGRNAVRQVEYSSIIVGMVDPMLNTPWAADDTDFSLFGCPRGTEPDLDPQDCFTQSGAFGNGAQIEGATLGVGFDATGAAEHVCSEEWRAIETWDYYVAMPNHYCGFVQNLLIADVFRVVTDDCDLDQVLWPDGDCDDDDPATGLPQRWYPDLDGDNFGDAYAQGNVSCEPAASRVLDNHDCNDADPAVNPDSVWYKDTDGDGYGDIGNSSLGCLPPPAGDWVLNSDDCDDADFDAGLDYTIFYFDSDLDGYGNIGDPSAPACNPPSGYVLSPDDCNDLDLDVHPGAIELCNGVDDDCDPLTVEDHTITLAGVNHATVQSAVDVAVDNDRIEICAGDYFDSSVVIDGIDLELVGRGSGNTRLHADVARSGMAINNAVVTLRDLTFMEGDSDWDIVGQRCGGGIYAAGITELFLVDTVVQDNSADIGAGICTRPNVELDIQGGEVNNNTAAFDGGGIWTTGPTDINGTQFTGNIAAGSGGAIHGSGGIQVNVDEVTIDGNSAQNGGGIAMVGPGFLFEMSIPTSYVNFNTADTNGGAFFFSNGTATINAAEIWNNTATAGHGGAVYAEDVELDLWNLDVQDNTANGVGANGGAVYALNLGLGSTFETSFYFGNQAILNEGGGLFIMGPPPALIGLTLVQNIATRGGGIFVDGFSNNPWNIDALILEDNDAIDDGGGMWAANVDPTLTGGASTSIKFNTANIGAGLFLVDANLTLDPLSVFNENVAGQAGGAVFLNGTSFTAGANIDWGTQMPGPFDDGANLPHDLAFDPYTHNGPEVHCFSGETSAISCMIGGTCTPTGTCPGGPPP